MDRDSRPVRKRMRLSTVDYSTAGGYFVTICINNRRELLSRIIDDRVRFTPAGRMAIEWWGEIPNKFPDVEVDAMVIMPNHLHGVILINADASGWTRNTSTLSDMVGWFKTMTTNAYIRGVRDKGWPRYDRHFWQPSFHEHVIRDDADLDRCREYVLANPSRWPQDEHNPNRSQPQPRAMWPSVPATLYVRIDDRVA